MNGHTRVAIGLMSGTSVDGIDAALVRTDGESDFQFLDSLSIAYETTFRDRLLCCARDAITNQSTAEETHEVERLLTDLHAKAIRTLSDRNTIKPQLVGFHGHTVFHAPDRRQTLQLGDGQRLADLCGIPVVYDFRSEDLRAGGQGAPLAPLFHAMLFANQPHPCAVVNIGGVANVTWLDRDKLIAGDTGPGCGLLDELIQKETDQSFDIDGKIASRGNVDQGVIDTLRDHPFFCLPFPKSADRFDFRSLSVEHLRLPDAAATLCEITATTIASSIRSIGNPKTTWVTGGGAMHPVIMQRLSAHLGDVRPVHDVGLRVDSLEAECFAWLAVRRIRRLPTSIPNSTGCSVATCGGVIANP